MRPPPIMVVGFNGSNNSTSTLLTNSSGSAQAVILYGVALSYSAYITTAGSTAQCGAQVAVNGIIVCRIGLDVVGQNPVAASKWIDCGQMEMSFPNGATIALVNFGGPTAGVSSCEVLYTIAST